MTAEVHDLTTYRRMNALFAEGERAVASCMAGEISEAEALATLERTMREAKPLLAAMAKTKAKAGRLTIA